MGCILQSIIYSLAIKQISTNFTVSENDGNNLGRNAIT